MTDSEKPFACPSPGCNMSFTNEDHLTVHKKKHDMVLNLGANGKNAIFIADQTPTPTRFIRNCEEVGLFQDLQNVNPFEETFRRAVEAGKAGGLVVPDGGLNDDTLHTPHIFPHITDMSTTNDQILSDDNMDKCSTIVHTEKVMEQKFQEESKDSIEMEITSSIKLCTTETHNLVKDKLVAAKSRADKIIVENTTVSDATKVSSTEDSPQLSIDGEDVQLLLRTTDGKLMQLSVLPISEARVTPLNISGQMRQQTLVIKTDPPLKCAIAQDNKKPAVSRLSLAKMKLKQVLSKSSASSANQNQVQKSPVGPTKSSSDSLVKKENRKEVTDQRKKKDLLERNRASSMRARAKRKAWIQQLERTVTNVNETNVALQMEVKALRSEVAKLKTLLLAHKDCPVTKAMQKGNGVVLGPKVVPEMITVPIGTTLASLKRPAAASQAEVSGALSKKKQPSIAAKNPVIFPKLEYTADSSITSSTVLKNIPLKLMGSSHYIAEKEETKQFLILRTPSGKSESIAPRQVIQVNPNYEIESTISKPTGR